MGGEILIRIFQKGFNFSQDGPGNRLVYHLQGCNLRCPWCSNPEGLEREGGTEYTVEDMIDEVQRSRMLFFDGGGVTLTGGEVTMQLPQVQEFLTRLHALGVHTCIETNGTSPLLQQLFPVLDLLIMDVKHYDSEKHARITGVRNTQTFLNIKAALEASQETALRIPLIGGFNASEEDARGFTKLFTELGVPGRATVELLRYHEYGKDKYKKMELDYIMTEEARVSQQQCESFGLILRQAGITIIHT